MKASSCNQHNQGFTLLEVLVAFLIIGIGFMGMAGLQLNAMKQSLDSSQRTQALWIAQEMIERMRANSGRNSDGINATNYTVVSTNDNLCSAIPAPQCATHSTTTSTIAGSNSCTALQQATYDLWELRCQRNSGEYNAALANGTIVTRVITDEPQDYIDLTSLTVACAEGPGLCGPNSRYTVEVKWVSSLVTDASSGNAKNTEVAEQKITLDFHPNG